MTVSTTLRIERQAAATWASHKEVWSVCTRCPLHENACKRVLARGTLPADVVFVGEAPGETEDALGRPFVGRAGKVLQQLINDSMERYGDYSYAVTNVVACIPFAAGTPIVAPPKESVEACSTRLSNFLTSIACPDLVIALGKTAEKPLFSLQKKLGGFEVLPLYHPSYILRNGGVGSLEFKRTLLKLVRALKEHL